VNEKKHDVFMGKVAQGVNYLCDLAPDCSSVPSETGQKRRKTKQENSDVVTFKDPVLLPIIAFNKTFTEMTLATFCCERRISDDDPYGVRLSLLYRKISDADDAIQDILTELVCHVVHFIEVADNIPKHQKKYEWIYLGPNCALEINDDKMTVSIAFVKGTTGC
jgi:hypothetical protein